MCCTVDLSYLPFNVRNAMLCFTTDGMTGDNGPKGEGMEMEGSIEEERRMCNYITVNP